jgi:hypothetical protein
MKRLSLAGLVMAGGTALADVPVVERVSATRGPDGWRFDVTVSHADEGWHHFADSWEIVTPGGDVLATRELLHPHIAEQPFTRSLSGVAVPQGLSRVMVRAHDSVHGRGEAVGCDLPD